MNKLVLLFFLALNISTASAAEFNWSQLAKDHVVNGQTLKISKMNFQQRTFAYQFCEKIGMELADIKTVIEATVNSDNDLKISKFKADLGEQKLEGVWAWTSEKPKMANDSNVFIQLYGSDKVDIMSFTEVNEWVRSKGMVPYKGLPAICRSVNQ